MTFTDHNLRDQITTATDASDGEYDIDAIVEDIKATHGAVDIDTLDTDEFWAIVGKHATSEDTEPVIFSVVRGASSDAKVRAIEPDAVIDIPNEVLTWAEGHGHSVDEPDVYLLVTPEDEAGEVIGEIAYKTFQLPASDVAVIRAAL